MKSITIIGAGAAGLFCAGLLAKQGVVVTLLDNGKRAGRKILMSGGGKCNFTNMHVSAENYITANPHFCKSALSRYTQWDFLALVNAYGVPWHEREHGQLFCDNSAQDIVDMLLSECRKGQVNWQLQTEFKQLIPENDGFTVVTNRGSFFSHKVILATGGQSMPALGMTPTAYKVAESLHLPVVPVRAGLVPLTLHKPLLTLLAPLSGTAVLAEVSAPSSPRFKANILFTHRGLSGPAILQIANYWHVGESITVNLLPEIDLTQWLALQRETHPNQSVKNSLARLLPKRLVETMMHLAALADLPLKQLSHAQQRAIVDHFTAWSIQPNGTEGYRTAEVTLGGISTDCLSSKTMAVKTYPNLHVIGEVMDVAGWLGGYNFQWAWSSAYACADAIICEHAH